MKISGRWKTSCSAGEAWDQAAAASSREKACSCERMTFCAAATSSAAEAGKVRLSKTADNRTMARMRVLRCRCYSYVLHPEPVSGVRN